MRRRNGVDELLGPQDELAGLGVSGGMAVEAGLGLSGQLDGLLRADQRLFDRLLDGRGFGHGGQRTGRGDARNAMLLLCGRCCVAG